MSAVSESWRLPGITTKPASIGAARQAGRRLWVVDLSQIWGGSGWLYYAFVLDRASRLCLGFSPHRVPHPGLIADALGRALAISPSGPRPRIPRVPVVFGRGCRSAGIELPASAIASAPEAALCQAFVAALRRSLLDELDREERSWRSFAEARRAIASWVDQSYNADRAAVRLGQAA